MACFHASVPVPGGGTLPDRSRAVAQFCTGAGSVRQNDGRRRPGVWSQEFPVSGGPGAVAAGAFRAGGSGQAVPGAFRVRRAWDTRCRMLSGFGGSWSAAASGTGVPGGWIISFLIRGCCRSCSLTVRWQGAAGKAVRERWDPYG